MHIRKWRQIKYCFIFLCSWYGHKGILNQSKRWTQSLSTDGQAEKAMSLSPCICTCHLKETSKSPQYTQLFCEPSDDNQSQKKEQDTTNMGYAHLGCYSYQPPRLWWLNTLQSWGLQWILTAIPSNVVFDHLFMQNTGQVPQSGHPKRFKGISNACLYCDISRLGK